MEAGWRWQEEGWGNLGVEEGEQHDNETTTAPRARRGSEGRKIYNVKSLAVVALSFSEQPSLSTLFLRNLRGCAIFHLAVESENLVVVLITVWDGGIWVGGEMSTRVKLI